MIRPDLFKNNNLSALIRCMGNYIIYSDKIKEKNANISLKILKYLTAECL